METEEEVKVDHRKRLDDWFDHKFLCVYQNTTNVEKARRELHRYQPNEEILEQIYEFVLADNRRRHVARQRNEFYAPPCNCWTFFHESRWMDKIPRVFDGDKPETKTLCAECGNEIQRLHGGRFQGKHYCIGCYDVKAHPDFKSKVYKNLCDHGQGKLKTESREEWLARMKRWGRKVISRNYGKTFNDET